MTHAECQSSFRGVHVREDGRTECAECQSPATLYVTWPDGKAGTDGDVLCGKHRRTYANSSVDGVPTADPKPIAKLDGLCAEHLR